MSERTLTLSKDLRLPLGVVTEATAIVATRGAGKSSTAAVLVEEAFGAQVPTVVIDWTGVFWGLRSNARGNGPGLGMYVLGGPHGDVPLEASAGRFIADLAVDSGHSFVLDLSDFTKGEMRRFCADFLERLYDRKARARTTLLLVIDEAHELAPQSPRGGFKGDAARLIGAMEQVVALGRSRGIGAVLITQRTQALNKAVLDLIETLIIMRMLSPRAVAAVRDWIIVKNEDDERGVLASLPELPTGSAWVWSPLRGLLERTRVRRIRTFDSYATPEPGEVRAEPQARRELDLDALGEQMRATVERAKAEDPRELRRLIKELRAQLEARPEVEPERVEVEIAVVPDAVVKAALSFDSFEHELAPVRVALESFEARARAVVEAVRATPARSARPAADHSRPSQPRVAPQVSSRPAGADRSVSGAQTNGATSGDAEQKILDALAWWETASVSPASRLQVAMVAGYHPRTGKYTTGLASLQRDGLVDFPRPGMVELLAAGRARAERMDAPVSTGELQGMIFRQVGERRAAFLREILAAHPEPLSRPDLAERLGYHPRTGRFTSTLGNLKALGLIEFPRAGMLAAADVLFLGALV